MASNNRSSNPPPVRIYVLVTGMMMLLAAIVVLSNPQPQKQGGAPPEPKPLPVATESTPSYCDTSYEPGTKESVVKGIIIAKLNADEISDDSKRWIKVIITVFEFTPNELGFTEEELQEKLIRAADKAEEHPSK